MPPRQKRSDGVYTPSRFDKLIVADIAPVSYTHCFNNLIQALKALPLHEISNRKQAELLLAPAIPELGYRQFLLQNLVMKDGAYCWRIDLDIFTGWPPISSPFPILSISFLLPAKPCFWRVKIPVMLRRMM
jgi:hypothetical protein